MDDNGDQRKRLITTGDDSGGYQPTADPTQETADSARYEQTLAATLSADKFSGSGIIKASQEDDSEARREQAEEVVFNVLQTFMDHDANEMPVDFRLLTSEIEVDEQAINVAADERIPSRYEIVESLGTGGGGQVFSIFDNNLNREVAAKFLHPKMAEDPDHLKRFIHEARMTASLAHPNILPIYDVDISDGGMAYFTMRKADGMSLADVIQASSEAEQPLREIADYYDRAEIMIKVCDAVAYAHNQGLIHQDLKPGNIILGRFGEVMVVDWGTAFTTDELAEGKVKLLGTPAYMAPEQARREQADERSDIYCIGATLYHLLTFRLPTWSADPETFWELKRAGTIQDLPPEISQQVPPPLLSIAKRAMAANPDNRYPSVESMREDLRRWNAGQAVAAHRDSLAALMRRFYRQYTAAIWVGMVGILLAASAGFLYYQEKQRERTSWHLVYEEDFSDSANVNLAEHWQAVSFTMWNAERQTTWPLNGQSPWQIRDGALYIDTLENAQGCFNLIFRRRLPGDLRIEWDQTALVFPDNNNCFIGGDDRFSGYTFHVGGYGVDSRCEVTRNLLFFDRADLPNGPLALNQTHHFVMERVGPHIRLWIDGQEIIDAHDVDPLIGSDNQRFGFEQANNRILIDNIRVLRKFLPEQVPAIRVADSFASEGRFSEAIAYYESIIETFADSDMAIEAQYRIATCNSGLEQWPLAIKQLRGFLRDHPEHQRRFAARFLLAKILMQLDQVDKAETHILVLADDPDTPDTLRKSALNLIMRHLNRSALFDMTNLNRASDARALLQRYREWESRLKVTLPHQTLVSNCLSTIVDEGYMDEVLTNYPNQTWACIKALSTLGRYEEIITRYPNNQKAVINALQELGRHQEVVDTYGPHIGAAVGSYIKLGRFDDLRNDPTHSSAREISILLSQRRYQDILAIEPDNEYSLMALRRFDELRQRSGGAYTWRYIQQFTLRGQPEKAIALETRDNPAHYLAIADLMIRRLADDPQAPIDDLTHELAQATYGRGTLNLPGIILPAWLDWLRTGKPDQLEALRPVLDDPRYEASGYHSVLSAVLDGTPIEQRFLDDDTDRSNDYLSFLCQAMHAELRGRPAQAREYYESTPWRTAYSNPPWLTFCRWRLAALGGTPPAIANDGFPIIPDETSP